MSILGIGLPSLMLIILLLILDYLVFFTTASPIHHIRHWHSARFHDVGEIKPVPFVGRMSEIDQLAPEDRSKLLQGLHSYLVKHAKHIVEGSASLPGIADGKSPSTVIVPANTKSDQIHMERVDYSLKMAADYSDNQLQRLNKLITPQLDVLRKKRISTATERK
jgi:hypothetical protein